MAPKFLARLAQALKKNKSAADAPKTAIQVGALIEGRYHLEAEIGRGGMGTVYRARDISNERDVAIKVININDLNDLSRQQFSREAQITTRLKHANIVAVYETGMVNSGAGEPTPFLVMEFVLGTGLDEMRGLTYARIIDIGQQICAGLAYAHEQGFVHRDLKPGNVLIEKHGFQLTAKLADFGLARPREAANLPSESNIAGSFFYLAPEVIAGQPADIGSDLYALGVMLYEMVTGRVPFSDFSDIQTVFAQHLEEAVAPPSDSRSDVPPELEAVILRLLEKNPKDRFASAQEVHRALEQISLAHEPGTKPGNLPQELVNCSECEDEIAQISRLLEANRLVTLLGGDGKLALATGARLAEQFADGVWQVDLDAVADPTLVLGAVAAALGARENPQRALTVTLIEWLREKNLLLLLCHCDRLTFACAQFAGTILGSCPDVRILATSQQPFNVPGEVCHSCQHE